MKISALTLVLFLFPLTGCTQESSETDSYSSESSGLTSEPAQKLTKDAVLGRWQLVIEIEELIQDEVTDEHPLVQSFLSGVGSFVENLIGAINIEFEFYDDNTVDIYVHASKITDDAKPEVERLTWQINEKGELIIDDFNNDKINVSSDGVWVLSGNKLVLVENGKPKPQLFMQRLPI